MRTWACHFGLLWAKRDMFLNFIKELEAKQVFTKNILTGLDIVGEGLNFALANKAKLSKRVPGSF